MRRLLSLFGSSIAQKALVAVTGLCLVLYLIVHLVGNLFIYGGPDGLNAYAEKLHRLGGLVLVIELALLVLFAIHIAMTLRLTAANSAARGDVHYSVLASKRDERTPASASKLMMVSGSVVLLFLVVHLFDFRVNVPEDLGGAVIATLQVPWKAALYIAGSLFIGWHLFHGIQSAFLSLGLRHPRLTPAIEKVGLLLAIILGLGFASIPLFIVTGVVR